ncbi:MAG: ATP-binding protein [Promethearchaeota archaeon]
MVVKTRKISPHTPNPESCGVVISRKEGISPNIYEFSFILTATTDFFARQGQFCIVKSSEGFVIGIISQIQISNDYFQNAQTVKNFDVARVNLQNFFPSDDWEYHIATAQVMGLIPSRKRNFFELDPMKFNEKEKAGFPVKPGNQVFILDGESLQHFLGFTDYGLNIGKLKHYDLPVKIDLNRLFNKHLAILAQSGAGKSYLVSVLLEELLLRPPEIGTPAMVLIDVHGEYRFLTENHSHGTDKANSNGDLIVQIQTKITRHNGSFLQIGVPNLSEYDFQRYSPGISIAQRRELRKAIQLCRKKASKAFRKSKKKSEKKTENTSDESAETEPSIKDRFAHGYDIKDIIYILTEELEITSKVRDTLIGWLRELDHLGIFAKSSFPSLSALVKVGKLTVLDISGIISMRKKQILLHYFMSRMFYERRNNRIPPYIIFLEEAHNFIPETSSKGTIAKSIFETIAREGRKFYAQLVLISQRPVRLSTTILSQCNSQIIMRITNPYDLNHIKATSEAITTNSMKMISTLPTGNAVILGTAINYPSFVSVRSRLFPNTSAERSLTDIAQSFIRNEESTAIVFPSKTSLPYDKSFTQEGYLDPGNLDLFDSAEN